MTKLRQYSISSVYLGCKISLVAQCSKRVSLREIKWIIILSLFNTSGQFSLTCLTRINNNLSKTWWLITSWPVRCSSHNSKRITWTSVTLNFSIEELLPSSLIKELLLYGWRKNLLHFPEEAITVKSRKHFSGPGDVSCGDLNQAWWTGLD